jgi:hypothetical protein
MRCSAFQAVGHSESRFYRRLRYAYLRLWKSGFSSLKYPTPDGYFVINFDAVALKIIGFALEI